MLFGHFNHPKFIKLKYPVICILAIHFYSCKGRTNKKSVEI